LVKQLCAAKIFPNYSYLKEPEIKPLVAVLASRGITSSQKTIIIIKKNWRLGVCFFEGGVRIKNALDFLGTEKLRGNKSWGFCL
jgi:hypothetical protein